LAQFVRPLKAHKKDILKDMQKKNSTFGIPYFILTPMIIALQ
jgi:hypothetical protein